MNRSLVGLKRVALNHRSGAQDEEVPHNLQSTLRYDAKQITLRTGCSSDPWKGRPVVGGLSFRNVLYGENNQEGQITASVYADQAGDIEYWYEPSENRIYIDWLYVQPRYRRKGIAQAMFYDLHRRFPDCLIHHSDALTLGGWYAIKSLPVEWNYIPFRRDE